MSVPDSGGALARSRASTFASEERFRLLVESVRDYAIFLLDTAGVVSSWNIGAERMKGYAASEIVGQHFSRFYEGEEIRSGKCEAELEAAARDGRFEDEGWRLRKDGSRFWANVIITALYEQDGTLVGFAKVTRDLTERRQAEEERARRLEAEKAHEVKAEFLAREQEARLQAERARSSLATLLHSIGDAVIATDEQGRVTLMNHVAETMTGWSADESRGRPLRELVRMIDRETRVEVESPADHALREGMAVGHKRGSVIITRSGRETPVAESSAPIRDDSGNVHGAVVVFRDATAESVAAERRLFLADATEALGASLDYRTTLAQVAALAVPRFADWCAVDLAVSPGAPAIRAAVAHSDDRMAKLVEELATRFPPGLHRSKGVNNVIRTGKPELYPTVTDEMLAASIEDPDHLEVARALELGSIIIVPLAAGTRIFGALSLAFGESGRRYTSEDVAFAEDLARRTASAIENARVFAAEQHAREAADAANRAKDDFLASVSHELRTPLNAILGWARLLNANLAEDKRARAAETIERNAVAMTQLIEDLLDVSRIVSGKMRLDVNPVDLEPVIEAAIETVGSAAKARGVHLESILEPTSGPILGDATRLQQIVWNLVSNGVKFTPKGGRVVVSLRESDGNIEISVTDTGRGIEASFLPNVFDPFRQADGSITRSSGGLGLGLAIVKNLVELHGGSIEAKSDGKDRGATFTVRLPVPATRPGLTSGIAASSTQLASLPQLEGLRVLVVDDERDARELVRSVLEMSGSIVQTAASVEEALAWFERDAPDVLLSDIGMPGENGYDLIRRIRALPPERGGLVPAAALTAFARAEDRRRVFTSGFSMHVPKPVEPAELVSVVAALARDVTRRSA